MTGYIDRNIVVLKLEKRRKEESSPGKELRTKIDHAFTQSLPYIAKETPFK